MSKRNLWGYEETMALISLIEEKDFLQKIDAKILKPNEIYQVIEQDMFNKGYYDKNAKQMHFRWQNLKKQYFRERKMLAKGEIGQKVSPYYERLDTLLSKRVKPPNTTVNKTTLDNFSVIQTENEMQLEYNNIVAYSSNEDEEEETEDLPKVIMPAFEECFPSVPSVLKPRTNLKRPHSPNAPTKVDIFQQKIKQVARDLNEDLFKKQKELIEYEFRLFANYTSGRDEKFKEIMATNTETFLKGIRNLMQNKNINTNNNQPRGRPRQFKAEEQILEEQNITEFFQTCSEENMTNK